LVVKRIAKFYSGGRSVMITFAHQKRITHAIFADAHNN
jgi:hypothetical protein